MGAFIDERLASRAGALVVPARAFIAAHWSAHDQRFPAGAAGLLALARRMRDFRYELEADDEADRRFVEGAGALLGLLLIAATPGATYRAERGLHLLQLSRHGFFDPFHAVDGALSAAKLQEALRCQVAEAEAEARGEGPMARVVLALCARLAELRPELRLADHFAAELSLALPGGELVRLDLAPTIAATRDASLASVRHSVDKLIAMLPGAGDAGVGLALVCSQLFPRVTSTHALAELCQRIGGTRLFGQPLVGELVAALVLEQGGRARYVRADELEAWGLSDAEALALATRNLAGVSERTRMLREDTDDGPIYVLRSGDGRDSARVLLPALRGPLSAHVGARAAVTLPHRDVLLACDAGSERLVERLRVRTEADAARAPHRVSAHLYVLDADGLQLLGHDG